MYASKKVKSSKALSLVHNAHGTVQIQIEINDGLKYTLILEKIFILIHPVVARLHLLLQHEQSASHGRIAHMWSLLSRTMNSAMMQREVVAVKAFGYFLAKKLF